MTEQTMRVCLGCLSSKRNGLRRAIKLIEGQERTSSVQAALRTKQGELAKIEAAMADLAVDAVVFIRESH